MFTVGLHSVFDLKNQEFNAKTENSKFPIFGHPLVDYLQKLQLKFPKGFLFLRNPAKCENALCALLAAAIVPIVGNYCS